MGRGRKTVRVESRRARGSPRRRLPPIAERDLDYLLDPESDERARRIAVIEAVSLSPGRHASIREGCNVMEAVSYLTGESWSSTPSCVSPKIVAFLRHWNDDLSSDELRNRLLKPLIPTIIDTSRDPRHEEIRSRLCADWLVRECTPEFLRLAGLVEHAERLESFDPLTEAWSGEELVAALSLARDAAQSLAAMDPQAIVERDVVWLAAQNAVWRIAKDTAWNAAAYVEGSNSINGLSLWTAASSAAWAVARHAALRASNAGGDPAEAARAALEPVAAPLQASAVALVERLAAVGRNEP
jgi:hypothetical protein